MAEDEATGDDASAKSESIPLTPEATAATPVEHSAELPPPPMPPPLGDDSSMLPKAPPLNEAPPVVTGPAGTELAGYWRRLAGYVIDGALIAIVVGVIAVAAFRHGSGSPVYLALVVEFIYASILIATWNGQTVGMKMMKIRCVDATAGSSVQWGKSFGRAAIHAVLGIIPLVGAVDLLWPAWDKRNQTLHDKVASTVVVKV